jgi:exosome complex RNA-binding protein Rrp4
MITRMSDMPTTPDNPHEVDVFVCMSGHVWLEARSLARAVHRACRDDGMDRDTVDRIVLRLVNLDMAGRIGAKRAAADGD